MCVRVTEWEKYVNLYQNEFNSVNWTRSVWQHFINFSCTADYCTPKPSNGVCQIISLLLYTKTSNSVCQILFSYCCTPKPSNSVCQILFSYYCTPKPSNCVCQMMSPYCCTPSPVAVSVKFSPYCCTPKRGNGVSNYLPLLYAKAQ